MDSIFYFYIILFGISCAITYCLFEFGLRVFTHIWLVDNPGPYGHKRLPVPLGFGVLLYVNFLLLSWISVLTGYILLTDKLLVIWGLAGLVTLVSFLDDLDTIYKFDRDLKSGPKISAEDLSNINPTRFSVSPRVRLGMQILVGLIIGLTSIKISYVTNIFGGITSLDVLSFHTYFGEIFIVPIAFTIIWYVLVFNSINWSDGVPGLTIWLTSITLLVIAVLTVRFYITDTTPALRENSHFVFFILAIVLPSALVAWRYNIAPKMLLWDSGTMFLAFMIASLALLVGGKVATVATALGVYLIDAIYVIVARISNKKNPLKWDRIYHLHYRLKALWISDTFIRRLVYCLAFFFGMAAAFMDRTGKIILFILLSILIVGITKIVTIRK